MTRAGALVALLACAVTVTMKAAADTGADKPAQYAYALPLQVSGKQAVIQLRLPPDVYLHARSPDLADLRVFDAAGTAQPFALTRGAPQPQAQTSDLPVSVFPVFAPASRARQIDDVQVHTSRDGAVVSVSTHGGNARASGDVLAGLVLDLGPARAGTLVSSLALSLPPTLHNYSAQVATEASDDLQHWEPLAETALSWLVNARGDSVKSDRIAFPARAFRYARITWLEGDPVEFGAITAQASLAQGAAEPWDSIVLHAQPGKLGQDLAYTTSIAVPAASAGLVLHGQNVVLPASIGRYVEQPGRTPGQTTVAEFRPLAGATFYRLTQDGRTRESGDIALPETHLAQWIVRPKAGIAPQADPPGLRLQWHPSTLVFMAGGTPPYTLAFGRAGAAAMQSPLGQVAPGFNEQELARLESATPGKLVEQAGGAPATGGDDAAAAGHRKILWLWGLLLCGVAFLGWMAWRLVTQLKSDDAGTPQ
jgi:hypothetical protein